MTTSLSRRLPAYDDDVDFVALGLQDADFAKVIKDGKLDFQDPKAVM